MLEDGENVPSVLRSISQISSRELVSEEDVKIKIVLPILRSFGYTELDFGYEGRTGRGYTDISVEKYPTIIVIEAKAPRKKLDNYLGQLETYVFHKHREGKITIAIITDGETFSVFSIDGALFKDSLTRHWIFSFTRGELADPALAQKLYALLGSQSNQNGVIRDAISEYVERRERVRTIDSEVANLKVQRDQIDVRLRELETERKEIIGVPDKSPDKPAAPSNRSNGSKYEMVCENILRILRERRAFSQADGVHRREIDEKLINKVEGIHTDAKVSHGIIELRAKRKVDHEGGKNSGKAIGKVWLLEVD
jgi:hypothetical protein